MIEPHELRVGNLVKKGNMEYVADFLTIRMAHNYDPIPLTPERLEKAGFEKIDHIDDYSFYSLKRKKNTRQPVIYIYKNKSEVNGWLVNHIQYLHQLQNLYFALVGEELTIAI